MSELWNTLKHLFDTDDGSLPDFDISYKSGSSVSDAYALIRDSSKGLACGPYTYWCLETEAAVKVEFSDNPAILTSKGLAAAFHIVFSGVQSASGKDIPDLGVFVWEDGLSIDYRMGQDWNASALVGLFELLLNLSKLPSFEGLSSQFYNENEEKLFVSEWLRFRASYHD